MGSGWTREIRDCWEDLALAVAVTVTVVVVEVDWGDEWVAGVVLVVLHDLVEKRCLMKCQEEERALWVLNLGWEGEEGCDKGETLRFFDGG